MTQRINAIFNEIQEAIEAGKNQTPIVVPEITPDLIPFIVRDVTEEEMYFITAKANAQLASDKMYQRVNLLLSLNAIDEVVETQKEDELLRFKAEFLTNLFFWYMQEETGWKFSMIMQRNHEGRVVLVGMGARDAYKYFEEKENEEKLAKLPASTLVN